MKSEILKRRSVRLAPGLAVLVLLSCVIREKRLNELPKDNTARVYLMSASLPMPLRPIARHGWFLVRAAGERDWERWDLWQNSGENSESWGHVHRNLISPLGGVGGGPPSLDGAWEGQDASDFITCLREESPQYPHRHKYRAWPGPNSNTYVEFMLRRCGLSADMPSTAIGKDYRGLLIGASRTSGGTGVQVETPLVGLKVGLKEGVEIHVLALTVGIDVWPPALKLPFGIGRLGFADW